MENFISRPMKKIDKAKLPLYAKYAAYAGLAVAILYGAIYLFTPKPSMPADLKAQIDSLTKANLALAEQQKHIDSTVAAYEQEVKQVDYQIDHIKEKTTVIREYYHEAAQQANNYNYTQVDSFLKARYNY